MAELSLGSEMALAFYLISVLGNLEWTQIGAS
jgi:hypothetical protein